MLPTISRSERGFTLVEMLTVIVVLGVLVTISMVTYGAARERTRLAAVKTCIGEIQLSLDDFARDHRGQYPALADWHNELHITVQTDPPPPGDYVSGVPQIVKRKGNALIGGSPPLVDTGNPLQDDFFTDTDPNTFSAFRELPGQPDDIADGMMRPIDVLVRNGHFDAYPHNPLAGPGVPMINIAHMLYDYDAQTNDFQFVEFTVSTDPMDVPRLGLTAARPIANGLYEPYDIIWTEENYPQGDFAYIPFDFSTEQGNYCSGYWLIAYGDLNTLSNSPYNKYSVNPLDGTDIDPAYTNWPNLPPPYGDNDPTTPPAGVEYEIKRLMLGALDVRTTIFEGMFTTTTR